MFFILFALSLSKIPFKYHKLVEEALKNAEEKVPKELREDTKYPGFYEGDCYHFTLTKTLSSAKTKDIKGFSYDDHNCAIIKRKTFNIPDNFAVIDPKTQKLFLLKRPVATESNIAVFESEKINIFHIMTNFKLESSSDESINNLPIKSKFRSKSPKAEIEFNNHWDPDRDRPTLEEIKEDCDARFGAGTQFKIGATSSISFNSIWDVSISFRLTLEGKFGVELLVPDGTVIEFDTKPLYNASVGIPRLSKDIKFLGLDISIGAYINIAIEITDVSIEIPLGFDYFKGYHAIATKYFEITPSTISDSTWEISISELPPADSINDVFKSVLSAILRASLQLRPYLSLKFEVGEFDPELQAGLKFPFAFTFSFNKTYCKYPYLRGDIDLPIKMYCAFTGLSYEDYDIIEEVSTEAVIKTIPLATFCIGGKNIVDDSLSQDSKNIGYYVNNDDFYEERTSGTNQVSKQVVVDLLNDKSESSMSSYYPLVLYGDVNSKTKSDRSVFVGSSYEAQSELRWSLNYFDGNNDISHSDDYIVKKISDLDFKDKKPISFPVEIRNKKGDNSDITHFTTTVERIPVFLESEIYERSSKYSCLYITGNLYANYTLLVIDNDGNRKIDRDCTFIPSTLKGGQPKYKGTIERKRYNNWYEIVSSVIKEDNIRIKMDIILKYDDSNEVVAASFVTPLLRSGDNYKKDASEFDEVYLDTGSKIYLKATIYKSENTQVQLESTNQFEFKGEEDEYINFIFNENLQFNFSFVTSYPMVLVETSYNNPYPSTEVLVQIIKVNDFIIENNYSFFKCKFSIPRIEKFIIMQFDVPEEFRNEKIYITFSYTYYDLKFIDENVTLLDDYHGIVDINGKETVEVLFSRKLEGIPNVEIQYFFIRTQTKDLIISPDGHAFKLVPKIYNAMLVPFFYGSTSIRYFFPIISSPDETIKCITTSRNIGNFSFFTFSNGEDKEIECIIYLTATGIGDQEPNVTVDLSNYQPLIDRYNDFEYTVHTPNGISVLCEMNNNKTLVSKLINGKASFNITDVTSPITFTAICANSSQKACIIDYPPPSKTGFHLIRYPNRDGISITGRGFLAEAIPVEKDKSFKYSKTYEGEIETYREYSDEPIDIKLKIVDDRKANYVITKSDSGSQNVIKRSRKICLADSSNNLIPFSRNFMDNNFFDLLKKLGIADNVDLNKLTNDENGCIVFDPKFIASNDFDNLSASFCDLNVKDNKISEVDKKDLIFGVGGKDKAQKTKIIIIVVVVVVVVVAVIVVVVVCIVKKKKKVSNAEEEEKGGKDNNNNDDDDEKSLSD